MLCIVLVGVLLVIVGVGGWFYYTSRQSQEVESEFADSDKSLMNLYILHEACEIPDIKENQIFIAKNLNDINVPASVVHTSYEYKFYRHINTQAIVFNSQWAFARNNIRILTIWVYDNETLFGMGKPDILNGATPLTTFTPSSWTDTTAIYSPRVVAIKKTEKYDKVTVKFE